MNVLIQFVVLLMVNSTALFIVFTSPHLSPINQTHHLTSKPEIARAKQALRYMLSLNLLCVPITVFTWSLSFEATFLGLLFLCGLSLFMTLAISPTFIIQDVHHLVINLNASNSVLSIHLTKPEQAFTLSTYRELGIILNVAQSYPVEKIQMRSPLFSRKQSPRNFARFEKFVREHGYILESRQMKWHEAFLNRLVLLLMKHIFYRNHLSLKRLGYAWYEVTLYRLR
ncbi:hypothetical protein ETN89_19655 (plasmid) [Photobacterium damselae subsp. damselae]|uniref:hypothetical protein n=1 Tax=Photobacterium damselae TaxID=38293 RepID=UPI000A2F90E8|nr:hypothetical protein [Photobacterium damselae]ARR51800.1 hypothetical protein CAY62_20505 [Photobacterium damselae subsp. damselae]QAY37485.1 hypothetical protein ETN89_19655 [Photobacterium damselae subsp. damselae]